jgi:pyruvate/2-oxoglutarate dehydrogenase complex dihydrolipoamide acyltransferase (E2) component
MSLLEVKIPDIGDFKDVDVVEILVKPGDVVAKEQSLLSLESDKATIEIPSPQAGVVREMKLKVGDKASQGTLVLLLEATAGETPAAPAKPAPAPAAVAPVPAPPAAISVASTPAAAASRQSAASVEGGAEPGHAVSCHPAA